MDESLTIRPITFIYKIHFNCIDENFQLMFHKLFVLMHNTTVLTAVTHMFFVFVFNTLAVITLENGHFTIHIHLI